MQMTAYELRISDWSSYVCSSDLHGLGIAERVDRALDVGHLALEAAQHVDDGVDLADVGEKLVAEALALGGAAHESGDVDELQHRRNRLCGLGERRQLVEARVGHRHAPAVGLEDRTSVVMGKSV